MAEPSTPEGRNSGSQSLYRALALLQLVTAHHPEGVLVADIASVSGLARSTTARILAALASKGYIRRDRDHRYRLGVEAMRIGISAMKDAPLVEQCRGAMKSLARQTGDTIFLVVPNADYGQCLHIEQGAFPIKAITSLVGDVRLLGLGTAGQALLAQRDAEEIRGLYERHAELFDARDISLDRLRRTLQRTRLEGYSVTQDLTTFGVTGIGVAFSVVPGLVAGMSVTAINQRMDPTRRKWIAELIRSTLLQAEFTPAPSQSHIVSRTS